MLSAPFFKALTQPTTPAFISLSLILSLCVSGAETHTSTHMHTYTYKYTHTHVMQVFLHLVHCRPEKRWLIQWGQQNTTCFHELSWVLTVEKTSFTLILLIRFIKIVKKISILLKVWRINKADVLKKHGQTQSCPNSEECLEKEKVLTCQNIWRNVKS